MGRPGRRRTTFAVALALAAAGALVGTAGPAAAGPAVTRCSTIEWQATGVVVPGDLLVDGPCELTSSVVHGNVRVTDAPYAYLLLFGSTIDGTLRIAGDVQLYSTRVGAVRLDGPAATLSANDGSSVAGNVSGAGQSLSLFRSDVAGDVRSRAAQNSLQEVTVAGDVGVSGGWVWILGSTLGGDLTVTRSPFPTAVCGTTVAGDVMLRQATGSLDVGQLPADSPYACTDYPEYPTVMTVGGDLTLTGNRGGVRIGGVHVSGDLVCRRNTGVIGMLAGVVVDGARLGQCAAPRS